MTRRPRWWSLATLGATGVLVATMAATSMAQSPSASTAPASAAPAGTPYPDPVEQPPAPAADITEYPNYGGEVDCENGTFNGRPYTGNLKKISAPDTHTVVFEFCNPDVAFLAQVAFTALAIDDSQYLIDHMADGSILEQPNGTGPYKLEPGGWDRGNRMVFTANDAYCGTKALTPNLEFRWSDQSAQRLVELQSGTVDGIDNPGKDDLPTIQGDPNFAYFPRNGLNTLFVGMDNRYKPWDDVNVRKAVAMGIDRQRIVDNFYPPGSVVADYFTPCDIAFACEGSKFDYAFDPEAAKQMLRDAGVPEGFPIKLQYRAAVRSYLPDPPTIAQEVASQLETNLGFDVTIEQQESGTFLDNFSAGKLDGLFLLGWNADFPDTSNFLDYHFGPATGNKFGEPYPDLVEAIRKGGQSTDEEQRAEDYGQANDLIKEHVPAVIVAHGGSGTVFKADVEGAHSSPVSQEVFAAMKAGDRDTLVWMQNAEPLSLYCGDETDGETLRACRQVKESLYAYEIGGTDTVPALATGCTPNDDLTVWTCTLRDGVTFHDGSTLEASDVVVSFAAQWDAISPLHVGRTGAFDYWPSLIGGGRLNPAGPCGLSNTAACTT